LIATFGRVCREVSKLFLVIALLGSIGAELAFAEPLRAVSTFRKLSCCTRNCATVGGVACQPDCCSPAQPRATATISSGPDGSKHPTFPAMPVIAPVEVARSIERPERVFSVSSRADPRPLLLLTQTLRL
jgi:hypothetical protein